MAAIKVDYQNSFIFILLCLFSLFCYSFFFFKKRKDSQLDLKLPPSPPSLPIIGHLYLFLTVLLHKTFQKISNKYGPLLYLRIFSYPIVLVSSAPMVHEIFRTHDINVSSRTFDAGNESLLFGTSSFLTAPYGDYSKFMKKLMITKLFWPQAIERSRGVRAEELRRFYLKLHDKAMKKERVEVAKEVMKFTNNMICRMSMGRSCLEDNGEAEEVLELIIESFALTKKIFFANLFRRPLEKFGISLFKKDIMGVSNRINELLERILVEHEEKLEEDQPKDMMDLLLEAFRDEKADFKITRNQIKSFLMETFMAGTDTSAHVAEWIMAEIVKNPNILERLREEIDHVVGKTRLIQETDLPNLPYLRAVVKEGLRLYPPSPLLSRLFRGWIKEYYVPEKAMVIVNAYAVMRDPDYWEDPNEFKPERFLTSSRTERKEKRREDALKYLPFGVGRRGCPGENVGYLFVETAVGMMVQCFDWKLKNRDRVSMEEAISGLSLTMAHPPKYTLVSRLDPLCF